MEKNLTTGSVFGNIVRFSLPYLLSYFLQTLYGMADLFIIGQYEGVASTTAVSIGSQVMHMLTVMIVGLAMGATVTIGQAVGARDRRGAAGYIGNTTTLFLALSVVVTGVLLALARPIAAVMSTPAEAVPGTVAYLRICFLGVPLITAYNIIASIFRGLGDSKRPMYFIARRTSRSTICSWARCTWARRAPRSAPRWRRRSAWPCRWSSSAASATASPSRGAICARGGRSWGAFCASACRSRCRMG